MTTLHDYGGLMGWPLNIFLGLSQFIGHGSWLVCEVALTTSSPRHCFKYIILKTIFFFLIVFLSSQLH
jgi:hypothetical protein